MSKKNILIIDDDKDFVIVLSNYLKNFDYKISVADDGLEGIYEAKKGQHPDLIILDINMRNIDGIETYDLIRENKELRDIPVIFVSANVHLEEIKRSINKKNVHYLAKPFNFGELLKKIQSLI